MQHHDARLRRIQELCDQLSRAVEASFRIRESADALRREVEDLALSTSPERRTKPRRQSTSCEAMTVEQLHPSQLPLNCPQCGFRLEFRMMRSADGTEQTIETLETVFVYECFVHGPYHFSRTEPLTHGR